jgi:TonB family protein
MIAIAWKATAILMAAFGVTGVLRGRSAALRHFIWTLAFAALAALPATSGQWTARPLPAAEIRLPAIVVTAQAADPSPAPSIPWLRILYIAGVLAASARFLIGAAHAARMARRGVRSTLGDPFGVRVVLSETAPMPLAWGILRPVVLLPTAAVAWPAARLRSVLLHESMHHRRHDVATQAIAQLACSLYWWHPLAWLGLGRQRGERERACDDAVLRHGIPAHDYASHLIEVVRTVAPGRAWSDAPAMAEMSSVESRVRDVLAPSADRRPLSRRAAVVSIAAAILLVSSVGTVHVRAQVAGRGTVMGVVEDPSGARVPNCQVTARNLETGNLETTRANAAGEYTFAIPPGHYSVEFSSPGFAVLKAQTDLVAGAAARIDGHLELGKVSENVAVTGRRTTPLLAPKAAAKAQRIRIGGNVQAMRLLRQPRPEYPPELQQLGVEGTVIMRAIISKDGGVLDAKVVNTADPRLAKAALDAVRQWRYEPTLLNGEPVETMTTITLDFQLEQ